MFSRLRVAVGALLTAALMSGTVSPVMAAGPADTHPRPDIVPGRYIVQIAAAADVGAVTRRLERSSGIRAQQRYSKVFRGFATSLSRAQLEALRDDPVVVAITPDRRLTAAAPLAAGDSVPTGVRRIGPRRRTGVSGPSTVNVAVVDSGIDLDHPDLNAAHGVNCVGAGPADDDEGHGTHVAGIVGARNNGAGVTGVAPGTKLYAVKVLDSAGEGTLADFVCGLDWVLSTRTDADPANDVSVVNASLGGVGPPVASCATTTDPMHQAVCRVTDAGVTVVAAAGNSAARFDSTTLPYLPAAFPEVLTVTAMADTDGKGGAAGAALSTCDPAQADDSYWRWSNYAATSGGFQHLIAAPGFCITSTFRGGGYGRMTGTSMAVPHAAGAVALCYGESGRSGKCAGSTPASVIGLMRDDAFTRRHVDSSFGFRGDPSDPVTGRRYGPLVSVPGVDVTRPTVVGVSPRDGATQVPAGSKVRITFSEAMNRPSAQSAFTMRDGITGRAISGTFAWSGNTMTFTPSTDVRPNDVYEVTLTDLVARDLEGNAMWRFTSTFHVWREWSQGPDWFRIASGTRRRGLTPALQRNDKRMMAIDSTSKSVRRTRLYGQFTQIYRGTKVFRVRTVTQYTARCRQTVSAYHWRQRRWVTLDKRIVGPSTTVITSSADGTLSRFVRRGEGARVRVACTSRQREFRASINMIRLWSTEPV